MTQLALFDLARGIPSWPEAKCGNCVHRNAGRHDPLGYCTPVGMRHQNEAPCDYWFGYEMLEEAIAERRPKKMAPGVGLEPTTSPSKAGRSTS